MKFHIAIAAVFLLAQEAPAQPERSRLVLQHASGSGQIRDGNGRLVDDFSKQELVCAVYLLWLYGSRMTCMQVERVTGQKPDDPTWCGEDLRPKAEACDAR